MATSEVWAGKVDTFYNVVTDNAICLGKIEFSDLADGFVKTLRMYNKNANRHLYDPQFIYKGFVYICDYLGLPSKTGRGVAHYWTLSKTNAKKMPVTFGSFSGAGGSVELKDQYVLMIPKSKVNSPYCRQYLE